jgi:hypothetical protein
MEELDGLTTKQHTQLRVEEWTVKRRLVWRRNMRLPRPHFPKLWRSWTGESAHLREKSTNGLSESRLRLVRDQSKPG